MEELKQILKEESLHHAYLIEGGGAVREGILELLRDVHKVQVEGNPDLHVRTFGTFGIDDGRELQSLERERATRGEEKFFILSAERMTREAQNALLKTFEEPTVGTHFFVVVPSAERLLPTLRSRMEVVHVSSPERKSTFAREFLAASAPERLALVSDVIEEKDRHQAIERVNELEAELHGRTTFSEPSTVPEDAFEALQSARSYLQDQSSSVKVLLEHLSVMLPQLG